MVSLRPAQEADYPEIANLFNEVFERADYISEEGVMEWMKDGFCCMAYDQDYLVGVSLAYLATSMMYAFPSSQDKLACILEENFSVLPPIGVMKASAVRPEYQRKGIGSAMVASRLEWMKKQKVRSAVCVAWMPREVVMAAKSLEASGFKPIATVPDFWTQAAIDHPFACSVCGDPCHCSAQIFLVKL